MLDIGPTPLDYFVRVIEFIYDPQYARHLRKVAARYDRDAIPLDLDLRPFIIDSLVFETYVTGQTLLEHFIAAHQSRLSPAQLKIYQHFTQNHLSGFRVLEHQRPERIVLEDLLDGSAYLVRDAEAIKFLTNGVHTIARLLPFQSHYVLTGACAIVNSLEPQEVLELARYLKPPPLFLK